MNDLIQIAAVGMLEGRERLQAISLNAANASLPGYRRQVVVAAAFDRVVQDARGPVASGVAATSSSPHATLRAVDLQRGELIATGRALDVAIEGDAFFALTDGERVWLTRAGSLRANEHGVLVGERGLRVVGSHGDIVVPGSEDVHVTADGRIMQADVALGVLQLFQPVDRASLQPAQGALLDASSGVQPVEAGEGRVRSGVLEASNTDAAREMLALVALSRQFEALSHVLQGYDQSLGRVIEKLTEG